jgi:hypothetical protein
MDLEALESRIRSDADFVEGAEFRVEKIQGDLARFVNIASVGVIEEKKELAAEEAGRGPDGRLVDVHLGGRSFGREREDVLLEFRQFLLFPVVGEDEIVYFQIPDRVSFSIRDYDLDELQSDGDFVLEGLLRPDGFLGK